MKLPKWIRDRIGNRKVPEGQTLGGVNPAVSLDVKVVRCIACGRTIKGWSEGDVSPVEGPDRATAFAGRPGYGSRFDSLSDRENMVLLVFVCDDCLTIHKDRVLYKETVREEADIVSKFIPR